MVKVLQKKYKEMHNESRDALLNYVQTSASEKKHDYTVMLHDLDLTYINLKDYAVGFKLNENEEATNYEIRQRSFEGYETIIHEMVNNGEGVSIHGLIMKEFIRQHRAFQEQRWAHQQEKLNLRTKRWQEVTGFILNRGSRDWRIAQNEFQARFKQWDIKAREQLEEGKAWWKKRSKSFEDDYVKCQEETAQASSREALKRMRVSYILCK